MPSQPLNDTFSTQGSLTIDSLRQMDFFVSNVDGYVGR